MSPSGAVLSIEERYTRSVHLVRDFQQRRKALDGYQMTPLVFQTLTRIVAGLAPNARSRAFSLVGPYGSGKSAFGLFSAHLLAGDTAHRRTLIRQYGDESTLAQPLLDAPLLLPVLVSGSNGSLRLSLLRGLREVLSTTPALRATTAELLAKLDTALAAPELDPQYVAELFEVAAQTVRQHTPYQGLLLVIDELGQFLDFASRQRGEGELFVLQTLAETAARSGATPILLVTILHQAFEQYGSYVGQSRRLEWAKVQGRFVDLPFQEPASEMLRMVGRALCPDKRTLRRRERQAWMTQLAPLADALGLRPADIPLEEWGELVGQCYPLHPSVLVALPAFFRQLAQNERSLFAFLTTHEPASFLEVVESGTADQAPPVYRLTHLYTYIETTLGPSLFTRARGRRWAELAEARTRLQAFDPLATATLTVIGTLGALGQVHGLRASAEQLSFALTDTLEDPAVQASLALLAQRKHIIYRQHRVSYVLYAGSDLDLATLVSTVRQRLADQGALVELLSQYATPLPLAARRHSYRSGTMRHFAVRYLPPHMLAQAGPYATAADGELIAVVPMNDEEVELAERWATDPERVGESWRIIVIPERIDLLHDQLLDAAALQHVLATQPELDHDLVARRELVAQVQEAEQALTTTIGQAFGPGASRWYWRGAATSVPTVRKRDELLSAACDETYHAAPQIWNELIARRQLSSAVAKARRNLIELMLDHADKPALGLEGYPPERAIYETLFRASGLHREAADGVWRFGPPPADDPLKLAPTWERITTFFAASVQAPLPITELYAALEVPPFGIKAGIIPLLVFAVYVTSAGDLALYEHGSFATIPDIALFERMLRQPNHFAIRYTPVTGLRVGVYERLARSLAFNPGQRQRPLALLDAVTPLLRFITHLPAYSKQTRQLSPCAQAVRKVILEARAPDELLFTQLPQACAVPPFLPDEAPDAERLESFFRALNGAFDELKAAYSTLRAETSEQIRSAFGATSSEPVALRVELAERYQRIGGLTADTTLRAFGVRLESVGSDPAAWVESVAALVARKPLGTWSDGDRSAFVLQLADLGRRFRLIEQLAVIQQTLPAATPVLRVGIADTREERSLVVRTDTHDNPELIRGSVLEVLTHNGILGREQQIAALAEVLHTLLAEPTSDEV